MHMLPEGRRWGSPHPPWTSLPVSWEGQEWHWGLPNPLLPPTRAHWPLVPACSSMLRCGPWQRYPFPHYQLPPSHLLRLDYEKCLHMLQNTELQRHEDFCSMLISVFHWRMARWAGKIFFNPSFISIIQTPALPTGCWIKIRATV